MNASGTEDEPNKQEKPGWSPSQTGVYATPQSRMRANPATALGLRPISSLRAMRLPRAVDGGGKGAHAVGIALSHITGRPLLGEKFWRTGSVAIITYEDDQEEWHRRIAAACEHHQVGYETAITSINFIHRPDRRVIFAAMASVA